MQSQDFCISMKRVATDLRVGRNKLFDGLREKNILNPWNVPYKQFIEAGYFKVKHRTKMIGYTERQIPVTMVTPLGKKFIQKLLDENQLSIIN
jgi:phage antirepressor YoqD-like protein